MKILHVIPSLNPEGGGPIEGIKRMQTPLESLGVHVEVASCDAPSAPWLADRGIPRHHALGPTRLHYGYTPRLVPWLSENARHYDAIVVHGLWQFHGYAVRRAVVRTGTAYFVYPHGMLDPWFKHAYPLKHLKKWLYWPWAEYLVLRDARAVLFTCEEERVLARRSFWLYRCNERVVSFGTSAPEGDPAALRQKFWSAYPGLKDMRLWLFLSRIHPKKGCDQLIVAFARAAQRDERVRLMIAGPDQTGWTAQLQRVAAELGIAGRIIWPGMLSGDLKWGAFHSAEVFILPSHQENFGIAVAEALACGVPVLISNKVNIWREIEQEGAGLVDADTIEGCARLLHRWLGLADQEVSAMRKNAAECFAKHFDIRQGANSLVETIQSLT